MRFERLDLNLLVALDALIELRSVSLTARRLNLTQPAVSAALGRLREFFGDDLLVASGRTMVPTAKADELRAPVREMLNFVRAKITTPATFVPSEAERKFVICGSDYTFEILVAHALRALAKPAPGLTFDFIPLDNRAEERLERGEVDILLTISKFAFAHHPRQSLFKDEHCVIACSSGQFGKTLTAEQYLEAGHAIAYFGPDRRPSIADQHLEERAVQRRIEVSVPSFSKLAAIVMGTDRLATIPRRLGQHYQSTLPLTVHPVPLPLPEIVGEMQWHKLRDNDQGIAYVRHSLTKFASENLADQDASKS